MLKIVIIGEQGYVNDEFREVQITTVGCDLFTKIVEINKKLSVKLLIWDTAGQEKFSSLNVPFYRGAHAGIMVYDITKPDSYKNCIDKYCKEFHEIADPITQEGEKVNSKSMISFPFYIIGNKSDLGEKKVSKDDVMNYFKANNKKFPKFHVDKIYELSATNNYKKQLNEFFFNVAKESNLYKQKVDLKNKQENIKPVEENQQIIIKPQTEENPPPQAKKKCC